MNAFTIRIGAVALSLLLLLGIMAGAQEAKKEAAQPEGLPATGKEAPDISGLVAAHNKIRAEHDLRPLTVNPKLEAAAQGHAKDMAEHEELSHEGSNGSTMAQRIERQGYAYEQIGENIAYGQQSVEAVMQSWMNSKRHRENILGDFTELGVAVATSAKGVPYWCVDFGRPMPQLDAEAAAKDLVAAINRERSEADKPPMTLDPKLSQVAQRHARDMAAQDKLLKVDSDGLSPFDRIQRMRLRYRELGMSDAASVPTAQEVIKDWLGREDLKANLLGDFSRVGVGYATSKAGKPYWSVIFGKPLGR